MKKLIVLMLALLFIPAVCAAEIDLSGMSYDELVALKEQINLAMFDCDEWESVVVPQGLWEFGKDIPVDHWTITAEDGDYAYFCYGDTLDETGLSLDILGNAYHADEVASSTYETEYRTNIKERIDIDAKDGYYIEIIYGNCVFSPYNGKQDLGFKKKSQTNAGKEIEDTIKEINIPKKKSYNSTSLEKLTNFTLDSSNESQKQEADALNGAITSVFDDDLNKYELRYNDLFIETRIDVVLTPSIEKKSYQLKVLELLENISEIIDSDEYEINTVYLSASCDFTDVYGNVTSKEVFYSAFRKDTIQKINFDNVYFDSIPQIADDWYEHPEFRE